MKSCERKKAPIQSMNSRLSSANTICYCCWFKGLKIVLIWNYSPSNHSKLSGNYRKTLSAFFLLSFGEFVLLSMRHFGWYTWKRRGVDAQVCSRSCSCTFNDLLQQIQLKSHVGLMMEWNWTTWTTWTNMTILRGDCVHCDCTKNQIELQILDSWPGLDCKHRKSVTEVRKDRKHW